MIRRATQADSDAIWQIFHHVIQSGDTYVFDPATPREALQKHWMAPYMHSYVYEEDSRILLGFEIVGSVPEAFRHLEKGLVDVYVIYRKV